MNIAKVNFEFREQLNKILGGAHHNYCYQCAACVASCPAARYSLEFNPRLILQMTLYGLGEPLTCADSPIWLCTNCYTCYERCPQDVRPIEVIIALKNLAAQQGTLPETVGKYAETVLETGRSTMITSAVNRRREELGLAPLPEVPMEEIKKLYGE
ncbi:MAG: 4Fe-4S dicluster domain-containing protein [candidate division KSB1 bacterium]|nr:4Fe-4S dicluster domain-containing protein [candidate division KSB1 bacterium]MDZ7303944.1 4Fe-4S dicluster domain-containing protein [candidate division KSB1 bacterium]MDZ7313105.1 4Fe-4S dicluster domain-containing protein [candidate division KSB1 bacterium]